MKLVVTEPERAGHLVGEVDHKLGCHTHLGADHVASQPVVAQQGHFPFPEVVQIGGEPRGPFTDAVDRLARDEHVADHDHQPFAR